MAEETQIKEYLNMQHTKYQERASTAVMTNSGVIPITDGVVGSYLDQEKFPYDSNILKHFTKNPAESSILEYGCGPGRNLLRLAPKFKYVAGVDISEQNIKNSEILFHQLNNYSNVSLYVTTGDNIPIHDRTFDVVFEVICLQHICSYTIRKRILTDMARICSPGGIVVCQFGFNYEMRTDQRARFYVDYYADQLIGVPDTNGASDCCVLEEAQLSKDFEEIGLKVVEIWHTDRVLDTHHDNWVWICGKKPE
jgi:ubiquinone/menaquinone biosynthesis C-methylase UbiE